MTTNKLKGKLTKERLQELYWEQGLSCRQIGEMFGTSDHTVWNYLERYEIPRRSLSEAKKGIGKGHPCYCDRTGKHHTQETRAKMSKARRMDLPLTDQELEELYSVQRLTAVEIAKQLGVSYTPIIKRLRERGIPVRPAGPRQGNVPWNKGLSKETSVSLREMGKGERGMDNPNNRLYGRAGRELLAELYLGQQLAMGQIAERFGVTKTTVRNHLTAHGIPLRSRAEANALKDYSAMEGRGEKISARLKGTHSLKRSLAARRNWQNPAFAAKVFKALAVRPTKPEKELENLLDGYFPQFKYNGDLSLGVTLGGLVPDFVNVNGKKELIELFGDYWHSGNVVKNQARRTEVGRLQAYNSLGYRCLVIWEHEMKDISKVRQKLERFTSIVGGQHG